MLKRFSLKSLFPFCFIFLSCCYENPFESYLELNPFLTEDALNIIELAEGISYYNIELENGENWEFGLSVPDLNNISKVPLIVALSGDGVGSGEYIQYLECQAVPGLIDVSGIIFAPDNRGFNIWEYENSTLILTIIDYALKKWPIDKSKIIVTGYSNGGYGAWYLGINYPQVFSAAIPIASRMEFLGKSVIKNEKLGIPFYVIHSRSDEKFDINDVSNKIDKLVDLGSDIHFEEVDYLAHGSVCAYSQYLNESIKWLENEVW